MVALEIVQRLAVAAQRGLSLGNTQVKLIAVHGVVAPLREFDALPEHRNRTGVLAPVVQVGSVAEVGHHGGGHDLLVDVVERHQVIAFGARIVALRMEDIGVEAVKLGVVAEFIGIGKRPEDVFQSPVLIAEHVVHVGADDRTAESEVIVTPLGAQPVDLLGVFQTRGVVAHVVRIGKIALRHQIEAVQRGAAGVLHRFEEILDAAEIVRFDADGIDSQRIVNPAQGHRVFALPPADQSPVEVYAGRVAALGEQVGLSGKEVGVHQRTLVVVCGPGPAETRDVGMNRGEFAPHGVLGADFDQQVYVLRVPFQPFQQHRQRIGLNHRGMRSRTLLRADGRKSERHDGGQYEQTSEHR